MMGMSSRSFGTTKDGTEVTEYTLTNANGTSCSFIDMGAAWVTMNVKDKNGVFADVVMGYDNPDAYFMNPTSCGECVGRNANRIAHAKFTLEGKEYQLGKNNNDNNLHSGPDKWFTHVFKGELQETAEGSSVRFTKFSKDGEQGFPGNLEFAVTYTLTEDDALKIEYEACADQTTIINPTNHAYFNLAGDGSGDVFGHVLCMNADRFTPTDEYSIPYGELWDVAGTPFDFREPKTIGRDIKADYEQLQFVGGYDHNMVLNDQDGTVRLAAVFTDPESGRTMQVFTDLPGMQLYTGNNIKNTCVGKNGADYQPWMGVCFETQYYPDAMNHQDTDWPQPIFKAGEKYHSVTIYKFGVVE